MECGAAADCLLRAQVVVWRLASTKDAKIRFRNYACSKLWALISLVYRLCWIAPPSLYPSYVTGLLNGGSNSLGTGALPVMLLCWTTKNSPLHS